ncbi:YesL family protein [Shouchella shacheensis]|uniref:YesL family protein n=1 Tax=Shouchella shacheensis TaxID=1649580 RepID=UPI00073FB62A|nr:YesL family protein [Shouchella shacheensis]
MESNNYTKLMRFLEWVVRFAYVNVLWLFFTFLGVIIFGFMPATSAMFAIVRKWLHGEDDFRLLSEFSKHYKRDFMKINGIGLFLGIIGFIIYVDLHFLRSISHWTSTIFQVALVALSIGYFVIILHIFPVFVHFKLSFFQYFKYSLMMGVFQPVRTFLLSFCCFGLALLTFTYPAVIIFFSGSVITAVIMGTFLHGYQKVNNKQNKITKSQRYY